jgi:hypothetical protein
MDWIMKIFPLREMGILGWGSSDRLCIVQTVTKDKQNHFQQNVEYRLDKHPRPIKNMNSKHELNNVTTSVTSRGPSILTPSLNETAAAFSLHQLPLNLMFNEIPTHRRGL